MDLVGPLPSSRGATHLFTIVDRTSHWSKAVPLSLTSAEDCARALVCRWISRFCVPAKITSDRRAQFKSSLWGVLCSIMKFSVPRPSVSNLNHLPLVMFGLQTTPHDETGFSVADAVYNAPLCLLGEFLDSEDFLPREFQDRIQSAL